MKGCKTYSSPVGLLKIESVDDSIVKIAFGGPVVADDITPVIKRCVMQLDSYFSGELSVFDLPLNPEGTTFQKRVWNILSTIPYGEVKSYLDIAKALDDIGAVRAVGSANGSNPIAIIIPCHRVIGKDGSLTGYAGGVEKKEWLLHHENAPIASQLHLF